MVKIYSRMKRRNSQLSCIKYDSSPELFIMGSLGREVGGGWDGHISFSTLFISDCFYMVVYIFIQGEKKENISTWKGSPFNKPPRKTNRSFTL